MWLQKILKCSRKVWFYLHFTKDFLPNYKGILSKIMISNHFKNFLEPRQKLLCAKDFFDPNFLWDKSSRLLYKIWIFLGQATAGEHRDLLWATHSYSCIFVPILGFHVELWWGQSYTDMIELSGARHEIPGSARFSSWMLDLLLLSLEGFPEARGNENRRSYSSRCVLIAVENPK